MAYIQDRKELEQDVVWGWEDLAPSKVTSAPQKPPLLQLWGGKRKGRKGPHRMPTAWMIGGVWQDTHLELCQ